MLFFSRPERMHAMSFAFSPRSFSATELHFPRTWWLAACDPDIYFTLFPLRRFEGNIGAQKDYRFAPGESEISELDHDLMFDAIRTGHTQVCVATAYTGRMPTCKTETILECPQFLCIGLGTGNIGIWPSAASNSVKRPSSVPLAQLPWSLPASRLVAGNGLKGSHVQ
jgi:hypothetical protein